MVEEAPALGLGTLTLFAFSADNWKRPPAEVGTLMLLFEKFLDQQLARMIDNGVRLNVIGRRDRLRRSIVEAIERAERETRAGRKLLLRIAVDYSAREAIGP